jgi:hypothetical protein
VASTNPQRDRVHERLKVQGLEEKGSERRHEPALLTVQLAASRLGVSSATLYALRRQAELLHVRASNATRLRMRDLLKTFEPRGAEPREFAPAPTPSASISIEGAAQQPAHSKLFVHHAR